MAGTITPVASTPATLGVTSQPRVTSGAGTGTGGGNAAVNTGYNPTPVTGGGPTNGQQLQATAANAVSSAQNRIASLGATPSTAVSPQAVASNAAAVTSHTFGAPIASNLASAQSGGPISDALQNGVAKIAAFAQNGIKSIEQAIQGDMAANNGQVDPAKMQQYTMQMSTFEMIMQMAAKIQEKQERAAQVWLQL